MRRTVFARTVLLTLAMLQCQLAFLSRLGYACDESDSGETGDREISAVLHLNLAHSEDDKEEIKRILSDSSRVDVKALADLILDEWNLERDDDQLQEPRLVWAPEREYPSEVGNPQKTLTVVLGNVDPDGRVKTGEIHRSTGSEIVDEECLRVFLNSLFRPALVDGHYVTSQGGMTCEVYLK